MEIFIELSIIIGITVLISGLMKLLKQPLIIGYIISGIIVSPNILNIVHSTDTISVFSQIGVSLLLFIVGLSLSPKVLKEVGKVSLITGISQIIFTSVIGFLISKVLGFSTISSMYIAIALTFSSTIIILKLLADKKDIERLYGKISIGFLLVQDIIVIIILLVISSVSGNIGLDNFTLGKTIISLILIITLIASSIYLLPGLTKFFAKSQELLFLFSIGWGLGLPALFHFIGLSMEIGALIAGITLSISPYAREISSKMRPLRDFFIILFFILLGSQMTFGNIDQFIVPAIIFSLFILIGNPLIVIFIMGLLGYKKSTSFQSGLTVAQISEFSLILVALGVKVGHISNDILSMVTIIGIFTIGASSYLILYSDKIYPYLSKYLTIFEKKRIKESTKESLEKYDIVLFGCDRVGYDFLKTFKKMKKRFLVIDYNPELVDKLTDRGIHCRYGDLDDSEFLDELNLPSVKMIISTVPSFEGNILLLDKIRSINKKSIVIVISHNIDEANKLYEKGATYVIMPHFLGSSYASAMIDKHGFHQDKFLEEKKKHIQELKNKKKLGHQHPNSKN